MEVKNFYEKPTIEIIEMEGHGILCSSSKPEVGGGEEGGVGGGLGPGEGGEENGSEW